VGREEEDRESLFAPKFPLVANNGCFEWWVMEVEDKSFS